jgi:PHD/YefM family antitoxin component YafN of YafNO toxin-antitoxin module
MNSTFPIISISQLKSNPAAALAQAADFPLQVASRGRSSGYLVGKQLFEQLLDNLENQADQRDVKKAVQRGELAKASDFESFAKGLGL